MRLLKFFAAFLVTAIVLFGLVLGLNWKSFTIFMDNREAMIEGSEWVPKTQSLRGLSEYMSENPEQVSVASVLINHADSSIYYEADTPRSMGALSNFFLLVSYASHIDSGNLTGDEPLNWSEISRYQLPDVGSNVHSDSYRMGVSRGWISNNSISLNNALKLLAEYNGLALSDYLWWKLRDLGKNPNGEFSLAATDDPLPFSGLYLAISPGIQQLSTDEIIGQWKNSDINEWNKHVVSLSDSFANNSDFRDTALEYMKNRRLGNTFMEERDALILFPKSTAREFTHILKLLADGELVNSSVSGMVMEWMKWPMQTQPEIELDFINYGAIYDNRMGLMNGIDFGVSAYTGKTTVQAIFFDKLPIAFWFHASGSLMHQDMMQRLIYDPAMIEQMVRVLER